MVYPKRADQHRRRCSKQLVVFLLIALCVFNYPMQTRAHPLGNFSINTFTRIEPNMERVRVHYIVDMAEIPTFQQLQIINANGEPTSAELNHFAERAAGQYAVGLRLTIDDKLVPLEVTGQRISTPSGNGNLPTLRIECEFTGDLSSVITGRASHAIHRLLLEDTNYKERAGWREAFIVPAAGMTVFDSSTFGNALTDELRAYPQDMLSAPLSERAVEFSMTTGSAPEGAKTLLSRDGRPVVVPSRDRLTELINTQELTPIVGLVALLVALGLGAVHAFSPGHGKAVVGAYLVGSRGTPRHAAFLGLTVTITHTIGVFALGLITLFASEYVLPEQLFPILSFASGGIVVAIGVSLFVRRLRFALGDAEEPDHHHHADEHAHVDELEHAHPHRHTHAHGEHAHQHEEDLDENHDQGAHIHSHGGRAHSHLPPGTDGSPVTWRNLLALGISGGLLPCPSALVVLLSAISLGRTGFGLLLVIAFSLGLAGTLTGVGLAFLYAGRLMKRPANSPLLTKVLPTASAFIITCFGAVICYEALIQWGLNLSALMATPEEAGMDQLSTASVLLLGLVVGLKHAVEADHLAAVSTIVSERKSILSSSIVGFLWGLGHTMTLLIAGLAVILLHIRISERTALALEFCVGIMLIALGANVIRKLARGDKLHIHQHTHGGYRHVHFHTHDSFSVSHVATEAHTHHGFSLNLRPLFVGMVHGLAGSAALMLLVLSTIQSPLVGLFYILIFGVGSIGGMMAMSALVGVPFHLTANRFARANFAVRGLAALFSLMFGAFMVYEIGFVEGLFR
ncbi:MAG: hypothetical protein M3458_22800 [Acidobacteriota bacterium]|nr:hypothetical protein [Acidobacteriota bacterium]